MDAACNEGAVTGFLFGSDRWDGAGAAASASTARRARLASHYEGHPRQVGSLGRDRVTPMTRR